MYDDFALARNMKNLGNILWVIFLGWWLGIVAFAAGFLCCVTLVLFPIGLQFFKISSFYFCPMNKTVSPCETNGFKNFVNALWAIFFGWQLFLSCGFVGCVFCITIIGIPFGRQFFKLARFIIWPLGYDFVEIKAAVEPKPEAIEEAR